MLVITLRELDEVVIGDPADPIGVVRLTALKGDRIRLAFDFPKRIPIHRGVIAAAILEQRREDSDRVPGP